MQHHPGGQSTHTVDGHKQQFAGLNNFKELFQVFEYPDKHLVFAELEVGVVAVGTVVDDAVHVEVQVVKLREGTRANGLVDKGVALREPAVKLGDTCCMRCTVCGVQWGSDLWRMAMWPNYVANNI